MLSNICFYVARRWKLFDRYEEGMQLKNGWETLLQKKRNEDKTKTKKQKRRKRRKDEEEDIEGDEEGVEEAVEDEGIVRKAGEGRLGSVTFRIARTRTFCGGCRGSARSTPSQTDHKRDLAVPGRRGRSRLRRDPSWRLYPPLQLADIIIISSPSHVQNEHSCNVSDARSSFFLRFFSPSIFFSFFFSSCFVLSFSLFVFSSSLSSFHPSVRVCTAVNREKRSLGFERDPIADDLRATGTGRGRVNVRSILRSTTAETCAPVNSVYAELAAEKDLSASRGSEGILANGKCKWSWKINVRFPQKFLSSYEEIIDARHFLLYIILLNHVRSFLFQQNRIVSWFSMRSCSF